MHITTYARICVEIDFFKALLDDISLEAINDML
jgi:hypothetical protein